ncbi:RagB/SusD family nutrient uptake outer membrane protein [Echinicola soli]|uniref:RagB/SusD family nutrient uptake outer membrane protein n=1 Tax=Echinicola soli TaxID=2591634 RepID=A0A514CJ44_9BACT|nr:RagB/SusD family nutrient uptake outer membrane protein [Echinicola soli]QDH79847.1 RagB/SusD family nutrient uptake outer membrane protein [Echinicola soli]
MAYKNITRALLVLSLIVCSCNPDYLDVSDELAGELTMEEVFSSPENSRKFHRNIFSGIPISSRMIVETDGLDNPWPGWTDELKFSFGSLYNGTVNGFSAENMPNHRWHELYKLIRQANLFMENAVVIPKSGQADFINKQEMAEMMAQARFLRAYYHYLLFELYGPIPIMDASVDPLSPDLDFARNSVDEVVDYVVSEMSEVDDLLSDRETNENFLSLPTKGVALAVKAKILVYAASPLYNGGYDEALDLTNPEDGKRLFPDRDPDKWNRALDAIQEFIDFAESGYYRLYKEYDSNGEYDPHSSLYNLFMKYNDEVIWATPNQGYGSVDYYKDFENRVTPRSEGGAFTSNGVTQELVDDFFMVDGLSIEESPLYSETGFSAPGEDMSGQATPGTYRMWINREPRFYQTVFYQGRKWHISNNVIKFHKGSANDFTSHHSLTGYLLYKRASRSIHAEGNNPKSEYRPSFIFRLAEFYLLYAEVLNEVNPSDPRIIEYIDKVRERAGIPLLADIKPEIAGDQEAQRAAVRREMRVELCTEGQRYFDVRRWMIAESPGSMQGGPSHGMDMYAEIEENFYTRTAYEKRHWDKNMYLHPIPLNEIQKSEKLVQNPGW